MNIINIINNYLKKQSELDAFIRALQSISLRSFLMGIGFGTTTQINRATKGMTDSDLMLDEFDDLLTLVNSDDDPFIKDILDYIDATYFDHNE